MYSTCLYCLASLGRNDSLAHFPVGRRIAFDPARGRLWAVCEQCDRWNLAPIEERWDAVEECERRYRGTHQRYGTDNIGLAGLRDGTELVRIGRALRPEVAVWRYGARMMRAGTRRRDLVMQASTAALGAGVRAVRRLRTGERTVTSEEQVLRLTAGLSGPGHRGERVLAIVRRDGPGSRAMTAIGDDTPWPGNEMPSAILRRRHLTTAQLVRPERGDPWQLEIEHELGTVRLSGAEGLRTGAKLFAAVNQYIGSPALIDAAVRKVDEAMQPDGYFRRILNSAWRWQWGRLSIRASTRSDGMSAIGAGAAVPSPAASSHAVAATSSAATLASPEYDSNGAITSGRGSLADDLAVQLTGRSFWAQGGIGSAERISLLRMPAVDRLALEMVAHEEEERAALDEELAALTEAWRDAEEIAAIADAL